MLLNNDTEADEGMVKALEEAMDAEPKLFSVAAKMINLYEPEKIDSAGDFYSALGWAYARGKDKPEDNYNRQDKIFSACAGAALYRRKIFETIGYFDENHFAYLEDMDIGYRANIYGFKNIYEPKARVFHAGSGVSGSRHNEFKVALSSRNSVYLIFKNMPFLQILLNLPFLLVGYLVKTLFFIKKGLGKTYVKGLGQGFKLAFSKEGRMHKVRFDFKHLGNYCLIQWELWKGMVLRFF
jgi:GT2 family glycosyltransferase